MTAQRVGNVPEIRFNGFEDEWINTSLMKLCSLLTGNPFQSAKFSRSGVFLVRGMNVKRGYLDSSEDISEYWPCSDGLEMFLLQEDDIVIQMDGALIGKSYAKILKEHLPALLVQRVTRVRCKNKEVTDFLYQYIQRDFLRYIQKSKTETAVPHLSLDDIRNFPIALASEGEQKKVGGFFRELDRMTQLHQRKHEKLKTLKTAMLQKMFPQEGSRTPEVRFKGFIANWEEKKLGAVGVFNPKEALPAVFEYVDLESVVGTEIVGHRTETRETAPSRAQRLARQGDLFFQTVRPYQKNNHLFTKTAENYVFSSGYAQIRPYNDGSFLLGLMQRDQFVKVVLNHCTGTSYPAINANVLSEISVMCPLPEEQIKIGAYFSTLDELISKHATQLQMLQQIKTAFLGKMFV